MYLSIMQQIIDVPRTCIDVSSHILYSSAFEFRLLIDPSAFYQTNHLLVFPDKESP